MIDRPPGTPPPQSSLDGSRSDPPWPDSATPHDAGDPERAFKPGFTLLDGLAGVVWSILAQVLVVSVVLVVGIDLESNVNLSVVTVIMQLVTLAGIVAWFRLRGLVMWRVLGPVRPRWRHLGMGAGLGVVAFLLVQVVALGVSSLVPTAQPPSQELLEATGTSVAATIAIVIATVALAPILEETIHRSLVFQSTRAKVGLPGAMVLSSLIFTFSHVEVLNSLPAVFGLLALALWLAAIFHRSGTLVVPVMAHATYNAIVLVMVSFTFVD